MAHVPSVEASLTMMISRETAGNRLLDDPLDDPRQVALLVVDRHHDRQRGTRRSWRAADGEQRARRPNGQRRRVGIVRGIGHRFLGLDGRAQKSAHDIGREAETSILIGRPADSNVIRRRGCIPHFAILMGCKRGVNDRIEDDLHCHPLPRFPALPHAHQESSATAAGRWYRRRNQVFQPADSTLLDPPLA